MNQRVTGAIGGLLGLAALAAWALRRFPRTGGALAGLTVAVSAGILFAGLFGDLTLAPLRTGL